MQDLLGLLSHPSATHTQPIPAALSFYRDVSGLYGENRNFD